MSDSAIARFIGGSPYGSSCVGRFWRDVWLGV